MMGDMKSLGFATLVLFLGGSSAAFGQPELSNEMAARCYAVHVLQGERVRPGTRTALIAAENADFWRSQAATHIDGEAQLDALLSTALNQARSEYGAMPGQGSMQIVFNASTCQTLRADIQPGYDPEQQNLGQ
jgi:hypothetical protein